MTKKRKRLNRELAPGEAPVGAPTPAAVPAATPGPSARKRAPADLARVLAAARAAEQSPPAPPASPPAPPAAASASARPLRDRVRGRTGQLEVLLFRVADERFAIELAAVEEAIDIPPVHHVPEMPLAMLGVITARGTLTSVYSPAATLGIALHDGTSALVFRRGGARLAVVVDEVDDVTTLDLSLLRDAPVLDASDAIVLGVLRQHDALLTLVDADALLAACQAVPLLETA